LKLLIDNQDGRGLVDYTACVCAEGPLRIVRKLNEITYCSMTLDVVSNGMSAPLRRARVIVTSDKGPILFTGFAVSEPEQVYAGEDLRGSCFLLRIDAASDEWLLDSQATEAGGVGLEGTAGQLIRTLTQRTGVNVVDASEIASGATLGMFTPETTKPWSVNAGRAAGAGYAAYRVLGGSLELNPVGSEVHVLSATKSGLDLSSLRAEQLKPLVNDIAVSGGMEAEAYVKEIFYGDGTTQNFALSSRPFRMTSSTLVEDHFDMPTFDTQVWSVVDSGSRLDLSGVGLQMSGGDGSDGQTFIKLVDPVEVGGTLVAEAGNVRLRAGSDGVLCGFYTGGITRAECFVGFSVKGSAGLREVVALVKGVEVGTPFTFQVGHVYTFRLRMHCTDVQRVLQSYAVMVGQAVQTFGGGLVDAPMQVVFEVQDLGLASNTVAAVLYDGAVASSPARCTFALANSIQLLGSIGSITLQRDGTVWMVSTHADGTVSTRIEGAPGEGADFRIDSAGGITFFTGRVPAPGELVTVNYRAARRSIARLQSAGSVVKETAGGLPGVSAWRGKVLSPPTRSVVDCENAASALLAVATNRGAAFAGRCEAINPQESADIWPGDMLAIDTGAQQMSVIVREVEIEDGNADPEIVRYKILFANEWAKSVSMKLSSSIASDAVVPTSPTTVAGDVLANLQGLQVTSLTKSALQIDAGVIAPEGGGFEVRRRDWAFGTGVDQDLVLRSPVRSFSIPREGQQERYFVRMYDGSNPPKYSRFSSAVFTNVPME
jgi:hypothetical protein